MTTTAPRPGTSAPDATPTGPPGRGTTPDVDTPHPSPGRTTALTLATALAPAVWGTTYIATTELLPADHPMFAALMRALPAGLLGLLVARRLPRGAWWWRSAVLGTLNMAIFFPLLFVAAERLPGGVASTLGATQPILITFLAVLILSERLSRWRLAWGVVGVLGVGLVVLGPDAALDPVGIAAGILGAASMGTGVVLTKRWGRPDDVGPVGFASWQLTAGGLVLLVPTLVVDGVPTGIDAPAVAGYAWLGLVGGLIAYSLWFAGVRSRPVTATALLGLLSPLVAAVLGAAVVGERLTPVQLVGFALALAALAAGQLAPRRRRPGARRSSQPSPRRSRIDAHAPHTPTTQEVAS
ncbi:EamA family transporter [Georgenia sp. Z1491]|uniref:EamA family transporter n=1 Tax=Georgenia sp. Z1491 TaxID=3416707 RepID=UPI003CE8AD21